MEDINYNWSSRPSRVIRPWGLCRRVDGLLLSCDIGSSERNRTGERETERRSGRVH